ncbi:MAG: sensor histidine kinase, partial [Chitinophagales bacterium]
DMNYIVQMATSHLNTKIEKTDTKVIVEHLPNITANRQMIVQLLENLISNAIKYKKEDANSKIELSSNEDEEFWYFAVKDNGIGIQQENLKNIFIYFSKENIQIKGKGIGLTICSKIIELHQGDIRAESDGKSGTTIHFSIKKSKNQL